MPTLNIEHMPDTLYELLKQRAAAEGHSISRQAILMLQLGLAQPTLDVNAWLAENARLRKRFPTKPMTMDEIDAAKREGRK